MSSYMPSSFGQEFCSESDSPSRSLGRKIQNTLSDWGLMKNIGIDLGTANTLIYVQGEGIVLNEPSIFAVIESRKKEIPYKVGIEAKKMIGKTPINVKYYMPMRDGVIADFNKAEQMLRLFLERTKKICSSFLKPRFVVCIPLESTAVERMAIQESVMKCGSSDVFLVFEPMAAAIGAGLDVSEASGFMIVDIGGGTSEISVVSLKGVVEGTSLRVAGNAMDSAIVSYIKEKYNVLIGLHTAEKLKCEVGAATIIDGQKIKKTKIAGRDLVKGCPREIEVSEEDIANALSDCMEKISRSMMSILEKIDAELAADIYRRGIVVTGGGALLKNIDFALEKDSNVPVYIAHEPKMCVIRGCAKIIEDLDVYSPVLFKEI